ncbi:MAG: hypothetical protein LBJ26_06925 [Paenibacillus sp.]|jgi:predicted alpha/beta superfamily hydrolase|nr:hypothetical protein [Paenibacillus sp.]
MIASIGAAAYAAPAANNGVKPAQTTQLNNTTNKVGLGLTLDQLQQKKGKGKIEYSGKKATQIIYKEKWFNQKNPVTTQYILDANNKVNQVTIVFENTVAKQLTPSISKELGKAYEPKLDKSAPSDYTADWKTNGAHYILQGYGKLSEMYITALPAPKATTNKPAQTTQLNKTTNKVGLGLTLDQLQQKKGKGKIEYSGKKATQIIYKEKWFNQKNPVTTQYILDANNKVNQVTIVFENTVAKQLTPSISKELGKAYEPKLDKSAPSDYTAHWKTNGAFYVLQGYGKLSEMYITALPAPKASK